MPVSAANTQRGGHERRAAARGHASAMTRVSAARGEDRARRRVEKGQLDLRLHQESARQQQVGTAGRQGLHARPQRRQCLHGRTVTARTAADRRPLGRSAVILEDDAGSSRGDAQIAPRATTRARRPGSVIGHEGHGRRPTTIEARPEAVLDVLTDPEAFARWAPLPFDVEDLARRACGAAAGPA